MPVHVPAISRRTFLAASAATAAGLAWPSRSWAEEPASDPNRVLLLADTHVWEQRDQEHRGVSPYRNFVSAHPDHS